jgi:hypothetical protein
MRHWLVLLSLLSAVLSIPAIAGTAPNDAPPVTDSAKPFIGHYYLSGIMETGSELLLRPDGSYSWFMSYGAVDVQSNGTWAKAGNEIVLTAMPKDKAKVTFSLGEIGPWNERFEQSVQDEIFETNNNDVRSKCAFLQDQDGPPTNAAMAVAALDYDNYDIVTNEEMAAFVKATADELTARTAYERAAASAMDFATGTKAQNSSVGPKVYHDLARSKRFEWISAQDTLDGARGMAKQPFQKRPEAQLPKECLLAENPVRADDINPSRWTKAVGVLITDTESGTRLNTIAVKYYFADGSVIDRVTKNRGQTWVPMKANSAITAIGLKLEYEGTLYDQKLVIPATKLGAISVLFPISQLLSPAFEEMRLKIVGASLVGFQGRGRYDRPTK